jgi:hypothetical protein
MSRENTVPTLAESGSAQLLMTLKSASLVRIRPYSQDTEIEPVIVSALTKGLCFDRAIGAHQVRYENPIEKVDSRGVMMAGSTST